jgi:ABC-type transporter Mla subunit MlaD
MSGQHEKLRQALDDLQAQLAEMRQVDPDVAAHLDTTISRAQAVLDAAPESPDEQQSVSEQFGDALLHYEASHPTLAGTLRSVVDALGQIGI